jgi:hypothetical protein
MILNPFAVIVGFLCLLRLALAIPAAWLAASVWLGARKGALEPEERGEIERRIGPLLLMAGVLLVLSILSWPVFYLLLQSYVEEWPGVMCIYGVTRVGMGSLGPAGFLPQILAFLEVAKPFLVFLSGAWLALYLIDRKSQTSPLLGRVALLILASSLLASLDAVAEGAYLIIPKKEMFLSSGCCTAVFDSELGPGRLLPRRIFGTQSDAWVTGAYYGLNVLLVLALVLAVQQSRYGLPKGWLLPLFTLALASLASRLAYLSEIAAPLLLSMPGHHCLYDILPQSPESLVGIALGVGACFFVGWGCLAAWLGDGCETSLYVPKLTTTLFRAAAVATFLSLTLLAFELALIRPSP